MSPDPEEGMHVPLRVFDLALASGGPVVVTFLREDAATRATAFLKQLAEAGALRAADGARILADGIHYTGATRELEVDTPSLKAARALGYPIDDDALEAALLAQRKAGAEVEAEPIEEVRA